MTSCGLAKCCDGTFCHHSRASSWLFGTLRCSEWPRPPSGSIWEPEPLCTSHWGYRLRLTYHQQHRTNQGWWCGKPWKLSDLSLGELALSGSSWRLKNFCVQCYSNQQLFNRNSWHSFAKSYYEPWQSCLSCFHDARWFFFSKCTQISSFSHLTALQWFTREILEEGTHHRAAWSIHQYLRP